MCVVQVDQLSSEKWFQDPGLFYLLALSVSTRNSQVFPGVPKNLKKKESGRFQMRVPWTCFGSCTSASLSLSRIQSHGHTYLVAKKLDKFTLCAGGHSANFYTIHNYFSHYYFCLCCITFYEDFDDYLSSSVLRNDLHLSHLYVTCF